MEYYVYVLKSLTTGGYYKGMTTDLDRRIKEHNNGECVGNKMMRPFELVFVQICSNAKDARYLEKYLKSGTGREIIREIV